MIRFQCPGCQATYNVGDEKAGKQGKCPKCQTAFVIPGPEPAAAPPPPSFPAPPPPAAAPNQSVEIAPCPGCGTRLTVDASDLGMNVQCPSCSTTFMAARPGAAPPPPPPASAPAPRSSSFDDVDEDRPRKRRRKPPEAPSGIGAILTFKKMITPFVIQIVFWLSVVGIILFGLYNAYQFITNVSRLPGIAVAIGGLTVLFGPPLLILFARVYAEVIIVFFRIHETLVDIKYQNERDD